MKNLRIISIVAAWFTAATISTAATTWTDVTKYFIKNPGFDNRAEDWYWFSDVRSQTISKGCISFSYGYFDFYQYLDGLPKGHYRLSVQGFYRTNSNQKAYEDHKNGKENIEAYFYGGMERKPLKSVFDEALTSNEKNNCYTPDNHNYYPNGIPAAQAAFEKGMYTNTLEFEAEGFSEIGIYCFDYSYSTNNFCVFSNFKLEYDGTINPATSIKLETDHTELVVGESAELSYKQQPVEATVGSLGWTSSNTDVVYVNKYGNIYAIREGTATISAYMMGNPDLKASIDITVVHNPATKGTVEINEIMASNVDQYLSPAYNYDGWMELYNPTDRSVELSGMKLTDTSNGGITWTIPDYAGVLPAHGFCIIWFDSNDIAPENAPFGLDIDGGTIIISDAEGNEVVRQDYPASMERVSYARAIDGTGEWGFTGTPTPERSNNDIKHAQEQLEAPVVDQPSQLFTGELNISVTIPEGCTLRYTIDTTLPTLENGETSKTGKFKINRTANYRFRLFADDKLPSRVTTRSYIFKDKNYYLPILSVVGNDESIYGQEYGALYSGYGPNGRPGNGQSENRNYNMNWERPVNFSYIDPNGKMVFNQDANLEACGGWSRAWYPHAFKLKGSKELGGDKNLLYPFFEQKPYIRNRTLQIRNGGNDNNARFKDPALQYLAQSSGINLDCQSYQPVHEFVNGDYIGVLNMREPNNKHYVYANYGWDDDEIDQFEMSPDSGYVQKCGTPDAFNELVDVLSADAANSDTYAEICRVLDIDAYANYMATQLYLGNWDWPQNNVKGFRHRDGGKFRFVLFDLDGAFDSKANSIFNTFMNKEVYTFDNLYPSTLPRHVNEQIRFVTLFKNLLKNPDFCRRFIDAFCIIGGSVYEKNRSKEIISELLDRVEPAMNMEWGGTAKGTASNLTSRLNTRLTTALNLLKNYTPIGLKNTTKQNVRLSSDVAGAKILINGQEVPTGSFDGGLFAPVTLRAQAPAGYAFKGWMDNIAGSMLSADAEISLPSDATVQLTATYAKLTDGQLAQQGITPVRINEVSGSNDSYIDEYGKKGDWLELYNTTDKDIDVEGMYLTDDTDDLTKYQITKGDTRAQTVIPAHGHLVVWCDNKRATTDNGLHASFKIDGDGGVVALTAADHSWTDVITYSAHDSRTTIGRYPDGSSDVFAMNVTTIGAANILTSYMTTVSQHDDVAVNTASVAGNLRICYGSQQLIVKGENSRQLTVSVYRTDGMLQQQAVLSMSDGSAHINVATLRPGFYVARATDSDGNSVSCKFMK